MECRSPVFIHASHELDPGWGSVSLHCLHTVSLPADRLSSITGFSGIALIVTGMVINSFAAAG